jgi:hypothetical protein
VYLDGKHMVEAMITKVLCTYKIRILHRKKSLRDHGGTLADKCDPASLESAGAPQARLAKGHCVYSVLFLHQEKSFQDHCRADGRPCCYLG